MNPVQVILVLLIFVSLAGFCFILIGNRLAANRIAQGASERGWHYIMPGWLTFSRPQMHFAGHTERMANWELRRRNQDRQIQFVWRSYAAPLEYGYLVVLPAGADPKMVETSVPLQLVEAQTIGWPEQLCLYSSHTQLAERLQDEPIVVALNKFTGASKSGSLVSIIWHSRLLTITCSYQEGWDVLDSLVALGEAILESRS